MHHKKNEIETYNQYYSTVVHLLIIYIAIFCHGTSLKKKHLATWGLEPASPVSVVNRHAISLDHHASMVVFSMMFHDKILLYI